MAGNLTEGELQDLYCWVDEVEFSRTKKNIARDFSDGVMIAELIKHYLPKVVDLHNYTTANSSKQKEINWYTLNKKIFRLLQLEVSPSKIREITQCKPGAIEPFLVKLRKKINTYLQQEMGHMHPLDTYDDVPDMYNYDQPEVDQNQQAPQVYKIEHSSTPRIKARIGPIGKSPRHHLPPMQSRPQVASQQQPVTAGTETASIPTKIRGYGSHERVPKQVLLEKDQELTAMSETMEILQSKVNKLEHLIQLKDMRIDELTQRLQIKTDLVERGPVTAARKKPSLSPRRTQKATAASTQNDTRYQEQS